MNFYAIPGAALVIVALLDLGALFLAKRVQQLRAMVLAGAIPLLLIGMVTQMLVQNASRQAWDEQKDLWTRLFEIAPNLTDRTGVIFVLPGYKNLGFAKNPPFVASWEVNWGMKVLYNNPHIFGAFYYPDINVDGEAEMLAGGVLIENEAAPIPYDKTVFVQYDQVTRHLKLLAQPGQDLQLPFTVQEYNSDQNILFAQLDTYQYRYLVAR